MHDESPQPISPAQHRARLARVQGIAGRLGFVGAVEYRHVSNKSGGAQYGMGSNIEGDLLLVYPEAFRRDSDPDDFSLEAILAHERGHQLICRHDRLRQNTPGGMSAVTEEVLASLVGGNLMMGSKKFSTIREELRAAFAREGSNPITSLDRRIRNLKKNPESADKDLGTLVLLRDALAQVVDDKPQKKVRTSRAKRTRKAI